MKKAIAVLLIGTIFWSLFLFVPAALSSDAADTTPEIFFSQEEAGIYIAQQMMIRNPEITFFYKGKEKFTFNDISLGNDAPTNDLWTEDTIDDYVHKWDDRYKWDDYLRWTVSDYCETDFKNGKVIIRVEYLTTYEQEQEINAAIDELLPQIIPGFDKTAYAKNHNNHENTFLIYDWLTKNVKYVHPEENSETDESLYTPYGALVDPEHEATCQGFALTFFRLAGEANIRNHIVAGSITDGDSVSKHMWNVVDHHEMTCPISEYFHVDTASGAAVECGYTEPTADRETDRLYFFGMPFQKDNDQLQIEYDDKNEIKTNPSYQELQYSDQWIFYSENDHFNFRYDLVYQNLTISTNYSNEKLLFDKESFSPLAQSFISRADVFFLTNQITDIEKNSFVNCSSLRSIYIPDSVKIIGEGSFSGCSDSLVIHCSKNSAAARYARDHGIAWHEATMTGESNATCVVVDKTSIGSCGICGEQVYLSNKDLQKVTAVHEHVKKGICTDCGTVVDSLNYGTCGDQIHWYVSNEGELVLLGSGQTYDYHTFITLGDDELFEPWDYFSDDIRKITVTEGITGLGNSLFRDCSNVVEIDLPDSLVSIGERTFDGCSSLSAITLPKSLTHIGEAAFKDTGIESILIPKELAQQNDVSMAFWKSSLKTIVFEEETERIPNSICSGADRLTTAVLPESVTEIGNAAFNNCTSLSSVNFPSSLRKIGNYTFCSCALSQRIVFEQLVEIGHDAFYGTDLSQIVFLHPVHNIGSNAFGECSSLSTVTFLASMGSAFDTNAFGECPSVVFHCTGGSASERYAKENNITCHTFSASEIDLKPATCAEAGSVGTVVCRACNRKTLLEQCELPQLDHCDTFTDWEIPDGVCNYCNQTYYDPAEVVDTVFYYNGEYIRDYRLIFELFEGVLKKMVAVIKLFNMMMKMFSA